MLCLVLLSKDWAHFQSVSFPVLHPSLTTSMLNRLNSQVHKRLSSQKILFFCFVLSFNFQLLIKPGGNQKRKRSEVSFSLCSKFTSSGRFRDIPSSIFCLCPCVPRSHVAAGVQARLCLGPRRSAAVD